MSHRKPTSKRQRTATAGMTQIPATGQHIPAPPRSLSPQLECLWHQLWDSDLAAAWVPSTDGHVMARLFSLYQLRDEALETIKRDGLLIIGSKGQPTDHPAARRMGAWDSEIRQVEDRMGLNPKARLNLGLEGIRMMRGISELAAVDDSDLDRTDPRLEIVK